MILLTKIMFISQSVSGPTWHLTAGVLYRRDATSHKPLLYHQGYHYTSYIVILKCLTTFNKYIVYNSATVQQYSLQQHNKLSVLHRQTNIKVTHFQKETKRVQMCACA